MLKMDYLYSAVEKTSEITSEQVLTGARRVQAQKKQKVLIESKRDDKAFDAVKKH